ncbi:putative flagellar microtugule protofilament ribbon protein [Histomonas meleagridis]|uniref:putative flagellar microtugule protofilament ribbon protein n=1 Tax=Histomonas meleagridis TaxID=135588 RepID=UPI003559CB55|nr:putative flagellar microtugule protofilament ribbon protein [Histomonas meleagridis]KAH0801948.1 putative flagellar microtugule protofilament ribbon protein [Histomonas meleagridis]
MSTILSFIAKLISNNRDDDLREFIVAYFLEEKAFSVVEKVVPNSGFPGGKFLQKSKINNPKTGKPYQPEEVGIGEEVNLNGWRFKLIGATEGTLRAMEANSETFSRSDLASFLLPISEKLKHKTNDLRMAFQEKDKFKRGRVQRDQVDPILSKFGINLGPQESITLFRRYQFADSNLFEYNDFIDNIK